MPITSGIQLRNTSVLEVDKKRGTTGSKVFVIDQDQFTAWTGLPKIGEAYSDLFPTTLCHNIKIKEIEAAQIEVTAAYSDVEQNLSMEISMEFSCEVMTIAKGLKWLDTNTAVDIPIAHIMPTCDYCITMQTVNPPLSGIYSTVGKLNLYTFHHAPSGELMFVGAGYKENYDNNGLYIGNSIVYKFTRKSQDHNTSWAEPRQKMIDGVPQFNPTTSEPIYVDGIDGTGRWTKGYYSVSGYTGVSGYSGKHFQYEYSDFATDLGLFKLDGDGGSAPTYSGYSGTSIPMYIDVIG